MGSVAGQGDVRGAGQSAVAGPFAEATRVRPLGDGTFVAELPAVWTVCGKPHGGFLLALLARSAIALQGGKSCVEGVVTTGRLPRERAVWSELPNQAAEPPGNAVDLASLPVASTFRLGSTCDVRLDPNGAGFLHSHVGDPLRLRLWVRPRNEPVDPLFTLVAADVNMPVTFNLGRFGWSPTVQTTALVRSRPAPGWLRVMVECRAVHGAWFDSDATVVDSTGRLVCQARQLALSMVG